MADNFVQFEVDAEGLANSLGIRLSRLQSTLLGKMNSLMNLLRDRIQSVELSGGILNRQSGDLADSLQVMTGVDKGVVVGRVASVGPAWEKYGKVHVEGGHSDYLIYPVSKKALSFMLNGQRVAFKAVLHPPLPVRNFLKSGQDAMETTIYDGLADAVNEALQ